MPAQSLRAFKARFDPELYEELQTVAELTRCSINQFVNNAVRAHLKQTRGALVGEYEQVLERLRAYSLRDPDFEHAIDAVVEAEVSIDDPVEGTAFRDSSSESAERRLEAILGGA